MTKEELKLLFELIEKAKLILSVDSIPEYISINKNADDEYKLLGISPSPYGDHEFFEV